MGTLKGRPYHIEPALFSPFLSESELFLESGLCWDPLGAGFVAGRKGRVADLGACSAGCLGPGIRYEEAQLSANISSIL